MENNKYKRGTHPNSLAALKTGKPLTKGDPRAKELAALSHEAYARNKRMVDWVAYFEGKPINVHNEDGSIEEVPTVAAEAQALVRKAMSGDTKAIELILKIKGELEEKLHIEHSEIQKPIVVFEEDSIDDAENTI